MSFIAGFEFEWPPAIETIMGTLGFFSGGSSAVVSVTTLTLTITLTLLSLLYSPCGGVTLIGCFNLLSLSLSVCVCVAGERAVPVRGGGRGRSVWSSP